MKNQALFSSKDKSRKLKCCLLQFLFGALTVKSKSHIGRRANRKSQKYLIRYLSDIEKLYLFLI